MGIECMENRWGGCRRWGGFSRKEPPRVPPRSGGGGLTKNSFLLFLDPPRY